MSLNYEPSNPKHETLNPQSGAAGKTNLPRGTRRRKRQPFFISPIVELEFWTNHVFAYSKSRVALCALVRQQTAPRRQSSFLPPEAQFGVCLFGVLASGVWRFAFGI